MEVATKKFTDSRNLDIPLTTQHHFIVPNSVKGRLTTEDYLFFVKDFNINFKDYDVLVESFNGSFKTIGELSDTMKLPHVHFVNSALLMIVPKTDDAKPKFVGTIQRGRRYIISLAHITKHGFYLLK